MFVLAKLRAHGLRFSASGNTLRVEPREALTDELRVAIRTGKTDILLELAAEAHVQQAAICDVAPLTSAQEAARQQVHVLLADNPTLERACVNRFEGGAVIVTLAIRNVGTCELLIPANRFNQGSIGDHAALLACLAPSFP